MSETKETKETKNGLKATSMGRDQFAALAMQGLIASPSSTCSNAKIVDNEIQRLAVDSYRIADAMIATRGGE